MANEKRLIDADLLRSHFLGYVRTPPHFHYGDWQNMCINGSEIDEVIETAPTVDAVEVVRCKDCKHWTMGYCNHFAYYDYEPTTNEDDFCSYGERREGE